jgi:1-acyl-sn-glycerol-3-phosphate acyltransferase
MTTGSSLLQPLAASLVTGMARLITGVRGNWQGSLPDPRRRIYFANHRSHGDFVLVWTVLPRVLRRLTRPVAAADYWGHGGVRQFFGRNVCISVLVDRETVSRDSDPILPLLAALDAGSSLILFPEGTRNTTEEPLLSFKSGIYRIASQRPEVELIPVWIENLNRVMPKGEFVPVPLLCTVTFGAPIAVAEGEASRPFRERSRAALLALAPTDPG